MKAMVPEPANAVRDTIRALGFLSLLPLPSSAFDGDDGRVSAHSWAFPLAGALIALIPSIVLLICGGLSANALLSATLAVVALVAVTGALHEDGLADSADGLFAAGGREERLTIMKDSRNGTFGTLALILGQSVRIAALAAIAAHSPHTAAAALPISAAVSRAAMVWHWFRLPPARPDGTAAAAGRPDLDTVWTACAVAMVVSIVMALAGGGAGLGTGLSLTAAAGAALAFTRLCEVRIGGHTGDTIGATQQLCEFAMLAALALVH
jgi:adenosylcobinamide-GDP ribazoletransferase